MSSPVSEQASLERIVRPRASGKRRIRAWTPTPVWAYCETVTTPPPQPPQPPYGGGAPASQPLSPSDEKLWATLVHVGGIFFNFLPALIGYLVLKDRGPFVRSHSSTALNFQLTMLIAEVVGWILSIIIIGLFIVAAAYILRLVFSIIAAIKANQGEWYTYPLSIKFVS